MQSILSARSGRIVCAQSGPFSPFRRTTRSGRVPQCSATSEPEQIQASVVKAATLTSALGTLMAAGNVSAAQEVVNAADGDGRLGTLALLALPALGWVGINILGPAKNQLDQMQSRSWAGLGLGLATLFAAQQANAASELAQQGGDDNRLGLLFLLGAPALGWVLVNILGPARAQLDNMSNKRRGIAGAIGLSMAALLATQRADAVSEVAQLAEDDNRLGLLFLLLAPALGWVLVNVLGPARAQLDNMSNKGRAITGAIGLSAATLLATQRAEAVSEVAQLAEDDNRLGLLFLLVAPGLGWVLVNILGPARSQLDNMTGGGGGRRR